MKKLFSSVALLLAVTLLLSGCTYVMAPAAQESTPLAPLTARDQTAGAVSPAPEEGVSLLLWCGDQTTETLSEKRVLLREKTPESLLAALVKQGAVSDAVSVNSCSLSSNGTLLRLDLNEAFQTALDAAGKAGAALLLGSVVNTFLRAYEATGVLLTAGGRILSSDGTAYREPMQFCDPVGGTEEAFPLVDPATAKYVSLTFDDGPHAVYTKKIAEKLQEYGAAATFFIVGNRLDDATVTGVRYALDAGCEVSIHGWTHLYNYKNCTEEKYFEEMSLTAEAIRQNFGFTPTLMRPIGGGITAERVAECPYSVILWSVDSEDWKNKSRDTAEIIEANIQTIVNNVMSTVKSGDIILMHEIYQNSYEAFCIILDRLYAEGYQVVTVSQLLGSQLAPGQKYRKA